MENYNINVILVGRRENHGIAGKWLKFSVKHFNLFFYKKF